MADTPTAPVVIGLAVGIVVIVVFSLIFKPASTLDDTQIIEKTKAAKEVKSFLQKYPDARITVDRLERGVGVIYSIEKQDSDMAGQVGVSEKRLIVLIDPFGSSGIVSTLECLHARGIMIVIDHPTVEDIDKTCF